jgi:addiction module HigA family antidote
MSMSKKLKPIHPGEHLREDFMKPLGLSSNALARALEVTPARINEILCKRRGISADTALRLARFFGTDAQSWLNLQSHYDIQCAEDASGKSIKRIQPCQALGKVRAMA